MQTYLTCAAVETTRSYAFEMGVALRLEAPEGTSVREDPHVPEVFYLETSTAAPDAASALVACGLAAAELVTVSGLPGEVAEVVVVDAEGALCWVPAAEAGIVEAVDQAVEQDTDSPTR